MKKTIRSRVINAKIRPYFSLRDICRRLQLLSMYDPQKVEVGFVKNFEAKNATYRTVSGQGIVYVKISGSDPATDGKKNETDSKPIIVIVAGIGGSDWLTVQAAMYIITQLVTSNQNTKWLEFDWWIIPLLNPDGYRVSYDNQMSRIYKANINPSGGCWGVNLDRNFLQQRSACREGKKHTECREYPGNVPFSEVESRALRDFILPRVNNCKVFVALKEGVKALVYPFASTPFPPPGAQTVLNNLLCVEALTAFDDFNTGKTGRFQFGNSGQILGLSSGYVEDWAKRHMGIPRSFAFHMSKLQGHNSKIIRVEEYESGTMKLVEVLAMSRRIEPCVETFEELIMNQTVSTNFTKIYQRRPTPWGRDLIHENLLQKINRGANLKMPEEFLTIGEGSRYDDLDFKPTS